MSYSGKPTYTERSWGSLILANSLGAVAAAALALWIGMAWWNERSPKFDVQGLGLLALTTCLMAGHGWSAVYGFRQIDTVKAREAVLLIVPFAGWIAFAALVAS